MDMWSARLANRLVGNADGAALLEVTLRGPEFAVGRDGWIAVTGARFDVEIGGRSWRSPFLVRVPRDTPVRFGSRHSGTRAYVAVEGALAPAAMLGSVSTHVRARLGGVDGRALQAGDTLALGEVSTRRLQEKQLDAGVIGVPMPGSRDSALLDVLAGA